MQNEVHNVSKSGIDPVSYLPLIPLDSVRDSVVTYGKISSVGGASLHLAASRTEPIFNKLQSFAPETFNLSPNSFNLILYPTVEAKGLLTRNTDVTHVDFEKKTVHRIQIDKWMI